MFEDMFLQRTHFCRPPQRIWTGACNLSSQQGIFLDTSPTWEFTVTSASDHLLPGSVFHSPDSDQTPDSSLTRLTRSSSAQVPVQVTWSDRESCGQSSDVEEIYVYTSEATHLQNIYLVFLGAQSLHMCFELLFLVLNDPFQHKEKGTQTFKHKS